MTKTTNCGSVKERYKKNEDAMEAGLAARPDGGMGRELLKPSASCQFTHFGQFQAGRLDGRKDTKHVDTGRLSFAAKCMATNVEGHAMPWHGDCGAQALAKCLKL